MAIRLVLFDHYSGNKEALTSALRREGLPVRCQLVHKVEDCLTVLDQKNVDILLLNPAHAPAHTQEILNHCQQLECCAIIWAAQIHTHTPAMWIRQGAADGLINTDTAHLSAVIWREHRRQQQRLQQTQQLALLHCVQSQNKMLFQDSSEPLALLEEGLITQANDALCHLLKCAPANLINTSILDLVAPESVDKLKKALRSELDFRTLILPLAGPAPTKNLTLLMQKLGSVHPAQTLLRLNTAMIGYADLEQKITDGTPLKPGKNNRLKLIEIPIAYLGQDNKERQWLRIGSADNTTLNPPDYPEDLAIHYDRWLLLQLFQRSISHKQSAIQEWWCALSPYLGSDVEFELWCHNSFKQVKSPLTQGIIFVDHRMCVEQPFIGPMLKRLQKQFHLRFGIDRPDEQLSLEYGFHIDAVRIDAQQLERKPLWLTELLQQARAQRMHVMVSSVDTYQRLSLAWSYGIELVSGQFINCNQLPSPSK